MHESRVMELNGRETILACADDIIIFGDSRNEMEENIKKLIESSKK